MEILDTYQLKISALKAQLAKVQKQIDQYSYRRIALVIFWIVVFVLFLNTADDIWRIIAGILLFLPMVVFLWIVKKQASLDVEAANFKKLIWLNENEVSALTGAGNGYNDGDEFNAEQHPYTSDLDIFGPSSLFAMINRCNTEKGHVLLSNAFLQTKDFKEILLRQAAIQEVSAHHDDTFEFRAELMDLDHSKIKQIIHKFNFKFAADLAFTQSKLIRFYTLIVPYLMGFLGLASLFLDIRFGQILLFFFIFNIGCMALLSDKVNKVYYGFSGGSATLNGYANAIGWIEKFDWKSEYLIKLIGNKVPVSHELRSLSKIIQNFDSRLNIVVGSFLNAFLFWDVRCSIELDKWLKTSSENVVEGFDKIGDFEELISLATLKYNHPSWSFPTMVEQFKLAAQNLGHPLIKEQYRVLNQYSFADKPTVDIVTGSNMAGKSTFLRTLGINMVLAYAGAPVCADQFTLSVFDILTYMRIKDSLNESTSTFKAELNRLKMILDEVAINPNALVLIDEMLRGTNSRDKFLGSKVFIEKLIELKTPALFATHDLQLSELEIEHPNAVRNYHFDIQIYNGEMQFDYKLKLGACKTFNAQILLKEIGLTLEA